MRRPISALFILFPLVVTGFVLRKHHQESNNHYFHHAGDFFRALQQMNIFGGSSAPKADEATVHVDPLEEAARLAGQPTNGWSNPEKFLARELRQQRREVRPRQLHIRNFSHTHRHEPSHSVAHQVPSYH